MDDPSQSAHRGELVLPGDDLRPRPAFSWQDRADLLATLVESFNLTGLRQLFQFQFGLELDTVIAVENRSLSEIFDSALTWAARKPSIGIGGLLDAAVRQNPTSLTLGALKNRWAGSNFRYIPTCPYPGMHAFDVDSSEYFFGRDKEIADLRHRVRTLPLVVVIGRSGSGKSSLVRAGLVPTLTRDNAAKPWTVRLMRPGATPVENLHATVDGWVDWREPRLKDTTPRPVLLVIDQFEECFTLRPAGMPTDKTRTTSFETDIQYLLGIDGLHIIMAVRSDYYDDLLGSTLWPQMEAGVVSIAALSEVGLRDAIRRPAEEVGVTVDGALLERLVSEAQGEPGVLPFLQETLALLWDDLTEPILTLAGYARLTTGQEASCTGLQAAMALHAEAVFNALKLPSERTTSTLNGRQRQQIAERIFMRLVQFGSARPDARRQQTHQDLLSDGDDPVGADEVIEALVAGRLLTSSGDDDKRYYDLAHEKLIQGWPRLSAWVAELKTAELTRRRLEDKALEHERLGPDSGLLDAKEFLEAQAYIEGDVGHILGASEMLARLIADSRKALNPGWHSWGAVVLGGLLLAMALWLGVVYLSTFMLESTVQATVWITMAMLLIGSAAALWMRYNRDAHGLQKLTHQLGERLTPRLSAGALIVASLVAYGVVGYPLVQTVQHCMGAPRQFALNKDGDIQVALVNKNVDDYNAGLIRDVLAKWPHIKAWDVTDDDVKRCDALFFDRIVHLQEVPTSAGETTIKAVVDGLSNRQQPAAFGNTCFAAGQLAYALIEAVDPDAHVIIDNSQSTRPAMQACESQSLTEQGFDAFSARNMVQAKQLLERAIQQDPDNVEAHATLGYVLEALGESDHAISAFRKVVALTPGEPDGLLDLAGFHRRMYLNKPTDRSLFVLAEDYYQQAIGIDKTYLFSYGGLANLEILGVLYLKLDASRLDDAGALLDTATDLLDKQVARDGQDLPSYRSIIALNRGMIAYARKDYASAITNLNKADEVSNNHDVDILEWLVHVYKASGDVKNVCTALNRLKTTARAAMQPMPTELESVAATCKA